MHDLLAFAVVLARIAGLEQFLTRAAAISHVPWRVCPLRTPMSSASTAQPIKMQFGRETPKGTLY